MKNSNEYINKSVFKVNQDYTELQNKTKELFFKCLNEGRDVDYFEKKLEKIWGKAPHDYLVSALNEYSQIIHENNMEMLQETEYDENNEKAITSFLLMASALLILKTEKKLKDYNVKQYKKITSSPVYKSITTKAEKKPVFKIDKTEYLAKKVVTYTDKLVPYYHDGKVIRHVDLGTYCSMIHNTNMTMTAWDTTLNDADELGYTNFYISYHPFSCDECRGHQNRVMSKEDVIDIIGYVAEETSGGSVRSGELFHPNCKCELLIYRPGAAFNTPMFSDSELNEQYHIRQKLNSLTLEKSKVLSNMKIYKDINAFDEYDKLNQKRNKINKSIRELQEQLPTRSLQKQAVAIYR